MDKSSSNMPNIRVYLTCVHGGGVKLIIFVHYVLNTNNTFFYGECDRGICPHRPPPQIRLWSNKHSTNQSYQRLKQIIIIPLHLYN